jgi:outer membrane receptor protein involved in Fe transport
VIEENLMKPTPAILALTLTIAPVALGADAVLEEVIVTAGFRDTPLLDQPTSTTVLTGEDIRQRAAQHLEDILNVAPNVNFASGASRARFFQIRGIGERSQFQEPLNPSIGFIVDGIDFSGLGTAGTLFDASQVEILRGPQGTYHGANALAGLINIRTGEPQSQPLLRVEATAADYGTWSAGIVGSGPLIRDQLLYRLAVSSHRSDGYIENDYLARDDTNDLDETTVRGKLRWLAGDTGTLDLTALYVDVDNGYDAFSLDNTRHTLSDQPGKDTLESTALGLDWHSEPGAVQLEAALTAATTDSDYAYDEDWSYVGIAPGWYASRDQYLRERDSYSAQLRLLSRDGSRLFEDSTDWVAGLYYLGEREDLQRRYTYLESDFFSRYDTDTLALFGQLDVDLGDRLSLITGLRLERRKTDYRDSNDVASDPEKDLWGGRLVLEYTLEEGRMTYAGVSRGYRANGVNAQILASRETTDDPDIIQRLDALQAFDAEYLTNYELGFKGSFLRETVRARAALFYMDRDDQQVKGSLTIDRDDGSTNFIDYTDNAAEGNNYGLELEVDWLASDNLTLYGNLGLLETEFDQYINAAGEDLSGRDQAHAPAYQYAVGGRFDFGNGFYLRLDLEGKDDFYFSDRHDVVAPSSDLLQARLGYATERWSVALWGRNLTDEDYYVRGFGSFGNDPRKGYIVEPYYQYGEPRLIGLSASYSF